MNVPKYTASTTPAEIASKILSGQVTRRSMSQQASRLKRKGNLEESEILYAGIAHYDQYYDIGAQMVRIADKVPEYVVAQRLAIRAALREFDEFAPNLYEDTLAAWMGYHAARGLELTAKQVMTLWAAEFASQFEDMVGELPVQTTV
ncbi:Uncharacterised protein [Serratia quinivorans]|uniref:hypothetical protein n=1 Tax=Serratia quinivorans TaxID=137545 RepID=UPI00217B3488|nr:hypothetical protein [Serratia quinivorans]CAI2019156.1 Uncharacterised protein [Serratia quinivorans]